MPLWAECERIMFNEDKKVQLKPCFVPEDEQLQNSLISDLHLLQDVLVFGTKDQQIDATKTIIEKARQYQRSILNY